MMKLKNSFMTHNTGDEQVLIDVSTKVFSGLVRSNSTAAFIIDCLKQETSRDDIIDAVLEKYDATREQVSADVDMVLGKLKGIGALDD
ncbi:MAG: PqqD family protein [Eubacterium sp.]|nr:PqqD family protein [Candidatus Colimonas fimequi]